MKTCPNCQTQYTDNSLRFCLQDGGVLTTIPATQQPTVSLAGQEMETAPRVLENISDVTRVRKDSEVTRVAVSGTNGRGSPKVVLAIAATALVMILLGGIGAFGLWLYFRDRNNVVVVNNGTGTPTPTAAPANVSPSPTALLPTPSLVANSRTPGPVASPSPVVTDNTQVQRAISQQVSTWRAAVESGDLDAQMRLYAPTVNYYRRSGASREFVRADRARAYRLFNSISVTITNLNVSVSDSGEAATAVFDKEWVFSGSRRSTGKVRQQLEFRRINEQWLITGERDLKVYYTN